MNVRAVNQALLSGEVDQPGVFPHLDSLRFSPTVFTFDFGLAEIPREPGMIFIRGARQYGKSTWLEQQLRASIEKHGPGAALYLNGDEIRDHEGLVQEIRLLVSLFPPDLRVKRIFIDEITAVDDWVRALKYLADRGELHDILVVTTGSKATDLRRDKEKGRLARTSYYFTPVSYVEFERRCGERLDDSAVSAYLLSGGCPIAAAELATHGLVPEFVVEMIRDWIYGECSRTGRGRASLVGVLQVLIRHGTTPCGQAKIAREAGLANNTVAAGYLELLMDLMCLGSAYAWDKEKRIALRRKPAKHPFVNLLAALAWHPDRPLSVQGFERLAPQTQAPWYEWLVAQELWRRAAIRGDEFPEVLSFWQSDSHEIDFVDGDRLIEVKRGAASPMGFTWFPKAFPGRFITVVNARRFETSFCRGVTLRDFLVEGA